MSFGKYLEERFCKFEIIEDLRTLAFFVKFHFKVSLQAMRRAHNPALEFTNTSDQC
jgi:hypothetical protein